MKWLRMAALLLVLGTGQALAELQVQTDGEVFARASSAPPADFIGRLGPPTAELPLRQGQRGLLYGNSLLLVFEGERLREVRCWLVPRFTETLFTGWLQQVESEGRPVGFVVDDRLRLGMPREQVSAALAGLEGDGDERSDVRIRNGRQLWLGYGPAPDYHLGEDPGQQMVVSISVLFED